MDRLAVIEALADERRMAIVELLAGGERCVCDVSEHLGISNALASHHLKRLREAGVVETRRKGPWLHCRLARETIAGLAEDLMVIASQRTGGDDGCCSRSDDD